MRTSTIGELTTAVATWNPSRTPDRTFEYIDLGAVDNVQKVITGTTPTSGADAPSRARQLVAAGDVLVSTVRPNLNAVAVVPPKLHGATASTGFTVLRPDSGLDTRFLFHWVRSPLFIRDMVRKATGASYPAISDRVVKESGIPHLSPIEQRRLATILDHADALRQIRIKSVCLADDALKGVYEGFFAGPTERVPLAQLAEKVVVGHVGPTSEHFTDDGVPFFRTSNVGDGRLNTRDLAYVTSDFHNRLRKSQLHGGDVLISRVISDRVRAAILPPEFQESNCANIILVRPSTELLAETIVGFLSLPTTQRALLGRRVGSAQGVVNTTVLKELLVPKHSSASQRTLSEKVQGLTSLRQTLSDQADRLSDLYDTLQTRAFRGEL